MTDTGTGGRVPDAGRVAFLLSQLGGHAAELFTQRIAELDLTPAQAGLLRAIAAQPGRSQQAVASQLGTPPSRLVALVDSLEQRHLIERSRNRHDRRLHAINLTDAGYRMLERLGETANAHGRDLLAALDDPEREQLQAMLARVADQQGLTPGVHPGYRARKAASSRQQRGGAT